jgi:tRNA dimethylallyltransferase
MIAVIRGEMSLEEAVVQMKRLTHQFVRRQANWFKESDPKIHWIDPDEPIDAVLDFLQFGNDWIIKRPAEELAASRLTEKLA